MSTDQVPEGVHLAQRSFPQLSWTDRNGPRELVVRRHYTVGAAATADLVLHDATVSRFHAELDPREEGLWIRDLESRNGLVLNGQRVREGLVPPGTRSELALGSTVIQIDFTRGIVGSVELWASDTFQGLVGRSTAMRELFAMMARIAPTDTSVLIQGETGTGKEVVARAIHDASHRKAHPYVVVDCAGLPENLLDAELFGHTRGAFTGAVTARSGAFETGNGGTVFLDEIGELPMSMQPKLLRVLEQRAVRRIGESVYRPVDVRFVSATHRDLLAMVARGDFREDLYFRLSVIPIHVPPLRNRREDIEVLVKKFLNGATVSEEFISKMLTQPWRGNVRELRNMIEGARALGEHKILSRMSLLRSAETDPETPSRQPQQNRARSGLTVPAPAGRWDARDGEIMNDGTLTITPLHDARDREQDRDREPPPSMRDRDRGPLSVSIPVASQAASFPVNESPSYAGHSQQYPAPQYSTPITQAPIPSPRAPISSRPMEGAQIPEPPPVDLASLATYEGSFKVFRERWIEAGERAYLQRLLREHGGNVASVARVAEVDRTYVYRLMRKYSL